MKDRLDIILVKKDLFTSREKAKAAIMAGIIFVDGKMVDKAGTQVAKEAKIVIKENPCPYVSRGGLKLEKALKYFKIDLTGSVCMDIGASTGGFTDCMLKSGAEKVYAIDVGYGQLDWVLRNDKRVVNIERTNIRYLDDTTIKDQIDDITIDVSFISLKHVFPVAVRHLKNDGNIIALVKPQFEAGKEKVGKGGIVRDIEVQTEVLYNVIDMAGTNGLAAVDCTYSPIKGAKGNTEFLLYLKMVDTPGDVSGVDIEKIVRKAQEEL